MVLGQKFGGFVQGGMSGNLRPTNELIESQDALHATI